MLTLFRVIKFEIYHGMDARIIYIYKVSNKIFSENITCLEEYPVTSNKKLILVQVLNQFIVKSKIIHCGKTL